MAFHRCRVLFLHFGGLVVLLDLLVSFVVVVIVFVDSELAYDCFISTFNHWIGHVRVPSRATHTLFDALLPYLRCLCLNDFSLFFTGYDKSTTSSLNVTPLWSIFHIAERFDLKCTKLKLKCRFASRARSRRNHMIRYEIKTAKVCLSLPLSLFLFVFFFLHVFHSPFRVWSHTCLFRRFASRLSAVGRR